MTEESLSAQRYLDQIEAENRELDQELNRLQVSVPSSESLRYSHLTSSVSQVPASKLSLPTHKCRSASHSSQLRTSEDSARVFRLQGVDKAVRELTEKVRSEEHKIFELESAIIDKQAEIEERAIRGNPQLFQPSVVATSALTQVSRKKQKALEE